MTTLKLPPLGDGVQEVTLVRWLKQPGQTVLPHEAVAEVETDKISIEVTADAAGTLGLLRVNEGDKLRPGDVLAELSDPAEAPPALGGTTAPQAQGAPELAEPATGDQAAAAASRISPVVRRMLAENGLNLEDIPGTGEGGRVTKHDVVAYLAAGSRAEPARAAAPEPVASGQPPAAAQDDLVRLSPMRARIAEHMVRSVRTSPHVTTVFEFNFTAVTRHREAHKAGMAQDGVNLTYLAYLVCATAQALRAHRMVNSQWTDDGILLKRDVNIGIAVAIPPDGLIVPVIQHANELSLAGIARKIQDLAQRGRGRQMQPHELQGGTFSITNHGASGSLVGTPIINQPQAGILGFGTIEKRVKVIGDMIAVRPCAYISFSFDHRILDGALADAFMVDLKKTIEGWP